MEVNVQQCCEILRGMDDIVILCHRNPDGDTLGSAFALHYILKQLGKPKNIVAVDIADEQLFGENLSEYMGKVDLCIDHHGSNKHYAKNWLVRDSAAANCEIIEDICYGFEEAELTKIIAFIPAVPPILAVSVIPTPSDTVTPLQEECLKLAAIL